MGDRIWFRWQTGLGLAALMVLGACGSEHRPLTTAVAPIARTDAGEPIAVRAVFSKSGTTLPPRLPLAMASRSEAKPPKSLATGAEASRGVSLIFQGEVNESTVADAALVLALSNLADVSPTQADLVAAAEHLLGDRFATISPQAAVVESTANFVDPNFSGITLEDVAAVLAARNLTDIAFDGALLAETATRAIAPVREIQASDITQLPIQPGTGTPAPEPTSTPSLPENAIGIPGQQDGTLSREDEQLLLGEFADFYDLDLASAQPGDVAIVRLTSDEFDPYLLLVDKVEEIIILDDDDSGGGFNSEIVFTVAAGTDYQIGVTSYSDNEIGSYTLTTERSEGPFTTLNVPGTINGILDSLDEKFFSDETGDKFVELYDLANVRAGQEVIINLSSEEFDSFLVLVDETGNLLDFNDDIIDGRGTLNSQINFIADGITDYFVAVTSFATESTGSYSLKAASPNAPQPTPTSLPTPTPTNVPTPTPTASPSPTFTPTPGPTPTLQPSPRPTLVPTLPPAPTPTPTSQPTPVPTPVPTVQPPPARDLRPSDPRYDDQYGFESINMPAAWGSGSASNSVAIAVIDDGVMAGGHPDLLARSPNNARFISELDSNGRTIVGFDDARGVDAADTPYTGSADASANNNPTHHGTHVAGTIAAISNNGAGVSGTVWGGNSILDVELISINTFQYIPQFSDKQFLTLTSDYAEAIRYAAGLPNRLGLTLSRPVDVINLSLGGLGSCVRSAEDAIAAAVDRGVSVVIAAGNDGTNQPATPASCPSVTLTVGATDRDNELANFSNYNYNDISAPGVGVLSTLRPDRLYDSYSGTSMATPHVAGAVAMLRAANPALSPADIKQLLQNSATQTGDARLGAGVLNVGAAFDRLTPAGGNSTVQLRFNGAGAAYDGEVVGRGEIVTEAPFMPGQILVKFSRSDRAVELTQQLLGSRARVVQMPASPDSYAIVQLQNPDAASPAEASQQTLEAIAALLASSEIEYAEPNYILRGR